MIANRYKSESSGYYRHQHILMVVLLYLLVSILLTWPLIFQLDSVLFGDYGVTRGTTWWVWAKTNGLLDASVNSMIAAPYGVPIVQVINQPVTDWLFIIMARLSNEIVAYNLYVFLAFPLTAIATYFLLDRLLHNRFAAFVGGLVFGFSPAAVMQAAGGDAVFAFSVFIPLFLLALFYNRGQRTLLSAFYVTVSFVGITFTALYLIYIAIFFVVFDIFNSKAEDRYAIFRSYLYCGAIAAALIFPFVYYQQIALGGDALAKTGQIRDFSELTVYSSRLWDFLIPSIDHPVLGAYFENFMRGQLHGSNISEQTLYLGMAPLGLLITGILIAARGKFDVAHRTYFLFFAFGALWMYFLSLPPLISMGNVNVPTVSYFANYFAPMLQVYARFGILVNFFVACAAAVVLAHLFQHIKRPRYYAMLAMLLPLLVFEYWSVPPGYALAVDRPPEVYQWLAKEPDDIIVAEYPMTRNDEFAFYTYLFWQRIHKKRLVNGASPDNVLAWDFFEQVKGLGNPATPTLLKAMGVKYVIVHTKMYQEGPIPEPLKRYFPVPVSSGTYNGGNMPTVPFPLKLSKTFGTDMVFSLDSVPFEFTATEILPPFNGAR